MNEPLGVLATPHVGFLALVVIGGLTGLVIGKLTNARHWLVTLVLIGVAGSWLGSQLADILGMAVHGSFGHFAAAIAGSVAVISGWQKLHPE